MRQMHELINEHMSKLPTEYPLRSAIGIIGIRIALLFAISILITILLVLVSLLAAYPRVLIYILGILPLLIIANRILDLFIYYHSDIPNLINSLKVSRTRQQEIRNDLFAIKRIKRWDRSEKERKAQSLSIKLMEQRRENAVLVDRRLYFAIEARMETTRAFVEEILHDSQIDEEHLAFLLDEARMLYTLIMAVGDHRSRDDLDFNQKPIFDLLLVRLAEIQEREIWGIYDEMRDILNEFAEHALGIAGVRLELDRNYILKPQFSRLDSEIPAF